MDNDAAKFITVVVLPTPPFWLITANVIGFFIFMMAQQEYKFVKSEAVLSENKVEEIMRTNFTRFYPEEPMYSAINEVRKGAERNFLILNREDKIVGLLEEKNILRAIKEGRRTAEVWAYAKEKVVAVTKETSLGKLYSH